jgi:hypothetical protein
MRLIKLPDGILIKLQMRWGQMAEKMVGKRVKKRVRKM